MTETNEERYGRQLDIVPPDRIAACKATVIGIGAIGRQVALQLTAMGTPRIQLVDHDLVEISNLASQGYREEDLGKPKVETTADACYRINGAVKIEQVPERFRRSMDTGNIVFCAVDRIDVRRLIWTAVKDTAGCLVDGRMAAEVLRILTVCDDRSRRHYPRTLFGSEEAFAGPCTAKTTIYCANIAAGLMVAQFAKYLRQLPIEPDIQMNLLTSELTVAGTDHSE
jgi:sulfur carrier protein ThiS adenylyltransferase